MNTLGKIFAYLQVIRVYRNGDGFGFVWRWWNPVTWVFAPLLFAVAAFFEGVPATVENRHNIGFVMDPYFIDNPEQLEWI